jgi:thymidylate synthase
MGLSLFHAAKYPVIQGTGESLALCTCWTDPQQLLEEQPLLAERFALIGTLYSKEGVSIMLRNLCLNPQIRYVLVWANGPLSKTAYGRAGREVLEALWRGARDATIQKELPQEALQTVVENVQLIDVSHINAEDLQAYLDEQSFDAQGEYMEPQSFPEPQRDASQPFPSERAGWSVHGTTVVTTWLRAIDRTMRYGQTAATEYGNQQKVVQSITWVVRGEDPQHISVPDWPQEVLARVGLKQESMDEYAATLLDPHLPSGITYTYGQRLRNYRGIDQVRAMVDRIQKSKVTRRAVAVTYDPLLDASANSPPCLNHVRPAPRRERELATLPQPRASARRR